AAIASFGGTGVSKIVNIFDNEIARKKVILYFLPVGILFVNGGVLGFFAVLYKEHVYRYLAGIFPHGFFEIPAIILSGAIGLAISEETQGTGVDFQRDLNGVVKRKLSRFGIVVLLIIIGGLLEGGAL
ncbi:MAG: stage II sporulation protein M, partial [Candidatus Hydrothermarchaeales archaeon]